ncbi:hypothetical protein ACHAXS_012913 [Conticribra weissflogii]
MSSKNSSVGISRLALIILLAINPKNAVGAIAIGAPGTRLTEPTSSVVNPSAPSFVETDDTRTRTKTRFRIRRTRSADLDVVSSMLAMESASPRRNEDGTIAWNWNDGVKRLRAKSLLEMQLRHRLLAVEEGRKIISNIYDDVSIQGSYGEEECLLLSDEDTCSILWSNDKFRSKVKSAVVNSQEVSVWHNHNFDLTPHDSAFLHHAMMSVVEASNGDVVGFCEVAWLPTRSQDEGFSNGGLVAENVSLPRYAPAIFNLVTSQSHRRMGIATRVIKFASKFVTTKWCSSAPLGLYVRSDNQSAMRLYARNGFEVVGKNHDGLLYMMQR